MSSRSRRLVFSKWLAEVLEYGRSQTNAFWVDRRTWLFAIRWVHAKSAAWSQDCAELFRLWHAECGRSNAALDKDMKTNFRMNLNNKRQFVKVRAPTKGEGRMAVCYYRFVTDPFSELASGNPVEQPDLSDVPQTGEWEEYMQSFMNEMNRTDDIQVDSVIDEMFYGFQTETADSAAERLAAQSSTEPADEMQRLQQCLYDLLGTTQEFLPQKQDFPDSTNTVYKENGNFLFSKHDWCENGDPPCDIGDGNLFTTDFLNASI